MPPAQWTVTSIASEQHALSEAWARAFPPSVEPIGFVLREHLPDRWGRFHNLPASKRYANSKDEYDEILRRQHELLAELGGAEQKLIAIAPYDTELALGDPSSTRLWKTLSAAEDGEWEGELHLYVSRAPFPSRELDEALLQVADDERELVLAPADFAWLVAPYDGGVDVIARNEAQLERLRDRHHEWLPLASPRDLERMVWAFITSVEALDARCRQVKGRGLPHTLAALLQAARGGGPRSGSFDGVSYRQHGAGAAFDLEGRSVDVDLVADGPQNHLRVRVDPWKVIQCCRDFGLQVDRRELLDPLRHVVDQQRLDEENGRFLWPSARATGARPSP